jgi:hypothetical protein
MLFFNKWALLAAVNCSSFKFPQKKSLRFSDKQEPQLPLQMEASLVQDNPHTSAPKATESRAQSKASNSRWVMALDEKILCAIAVPMQASAAFFRKIQLQ